MFKFQCSSLNIYIRRGASKVHTFSLGHTYHAISNTTDRPLKRSSPTLTPQPSPRWLLNISTSPLNRHPTRCYQKSSRPTRRLDQTSHLKPTQLTLLTILHGRTYKLRAKIPLSAHGCTNHFSATHMRDHLFSYRLEFKNSDIQAYVYSCTTRANHKGAYGKWAN